MTFRVDVPITWAHFVTAFHANYIPATLMAKKKAEFIKLSMGTHSVKEYWHAFNNLSRYAPKMVATEADKIESFKRGLSTKLLKTMGNSTRANFSDFVNDCLNQDDNNQLHAAGKIRKRPFESGPS